MAACGGTPRRTPTAQDRARIAAAVADVVYQCQSVAAGYIAGAESGSLKRDVDALLRASREVRPDVSFVVGHPPGLTQRNQPAKAARPR